MTPTQEPGKDALMPDYLGNTVERLRLWADEMEACAEGQYASLNAVVQQMRLTSDELEDGKAALLARVQELEQWIARLKTDGHMVWSLMLRGDIIKPVALIESASLPQEPST